MGRGRVDEGVIFFLPLLHTSCSPSILPFVPNPTLHLLPHSRTFCIQRNSGCTIMAMHILISWTCVHDMRNERLLAWRVRVRASSQTLTSPRQAPSFGKYLITKASFIFP